MPLWPPVFANYEAVAGEGGVEGLEHLASTCSYVIILVTAAVATLSCAAQASDAPVRTWSPTILTWHADTRASVLRPPS